MKKKPGKTATEVRIVEAAVQLFVRNGFRDTTTRDISRVAQVNEVTLFPYFPRKADLFCAAAESRLSCIGMGRELQSKLATDELSGLTFASSFWLLGQECLGKTPINDLSLNDQNNSLEGLVPRTSMCLSLLKMRCVNPGIQPESRKVLSESVGVVPKGFASSGGTKEATPSF